MEFITVQVARRERKGSANSRRVRREGNVPAVLYGLGRENADLAISAEELERFLKTGSQLLELKLGDLTQQAILRDVQYDPMTDRIVHVDLLRIDRDHEIEADVHLEYKGVAKGIAEGGVFEPVLGRLRVKATPARLPKVITIDVSGLALNDAVTVKDVKLPEGVKALGHRPDDHLCHVVAPKVVSLEPATTAAAETPAEPERIGGKKPEEEAGAEGAKAAPAAAAPAPKKDEKKK